MKKGRMVGAYNGGNGLSYVTAAGGRVLTEDERWALALRMRGEDGADALRAADDFVRCNMPLLVLLLAQRGITDSSLIWDEMWSEGLECMLEAGKTWKRTFTTKQGEVKPAKFAGWLNLILMQRGKNAWGRMGCCGVGIPAAVWRDTWKVWRWRMHELDEQDEGRKLGWSEARVKRAQDVLGMAWEHPDTGVLETDSNGTGNRLENGEEALFGDSTGACRVAAVEIADEIMSAAGLTSEEEYLVRRLYGIGKLEKCDKVDTLCAELSVSRKAFHNMKAVILGKMKDSAKKLQLEDAARKVLRNEGETIA